ncbi:hypothetical protein M0R45_011398 [Rubus argutus]|uniref:Uncharacterized protein n=1 Tax=Rubus argutus TaxID=59490 RepID=A0AAW1YA16_RUBAR
MGSTLVRKRVRLIEEYPHFENEMSLVKHGDDSGHDNVDIRCWDHDLVDDVDPWFICLKNLRGDEKSHSPEVVRDNGISKLRRYHQDEGLGRRIKRRCISSENMENEGVDPQWKLFLENLREDGNSYAMEGVRENGVSELIRYHRGDGLPRRIKRGCISNEDVDPQWKLFLENLREDGNSYALVAVRENGASELIRYHREDGLPRRIKRGWISNEDVDPRWKLFLESLREDGNSYALEVVGGNGVSELIRYHREDGFARQVKRRCISIEDVDPQYKLFKESLREDGNSYALEVVRGSWIRYHQDKGLGRRVKRRCISNQKLEELMLVENCEKTLSLVEHGSDENEHSGDNNIDFRSVDDSHNGYGFPHDDNSDNNENEHSGDDNTDVQLLHEGDNWNKQSGDHTVYVKSLDDEIVDSNSKLFLENLREDRNSYSQKIVQETGFPKLTRYHRNNGLPDEPSLATAETMKNSQVKEKTEIKNRDTLESLEDLPKRKSSVVKKNAELAALDPASGMTNWVSSKRPCPEVPHNREELKSDTPETLKNSQVKEKTGIENRNTVKLYENRQEKRSSVVKKNAKLETLNPVSGRTNGHSSKRPHLESAHLLDEEDTKRLNTSRNKRNETLQSFEDLPEKKSSMVKENAKGKATYPASDRTNGRPNKRPGSEVLHFAKRGSNDEDDSENLSDESYKKFLSLVVMDDIDMTFAPQNGRPETYDVDIKEENTESSSDSDLIVLERDPLDGCRTPIKKDPDNSMESDTNFRKRLMKDLTRPYDSEEYIKLLEDWTRQRSAAGHAKNLRSGVIKTYALEGEYGKPYLEMYKDLAGMIKASDRPVSLNLLRGFFYWLKNVAQEGSFEPWRDEECLNVVPQL